MTSQWFEGTQSSLLRADKFDLGSDHTLSIIPQMMGALRFCLLALAISIGVRFALILTH